MGRKTLTGTGKQCNAHGIRYIDDEGEDGHGDECHEGMGIHQPGRASSVVRLTLHSVNNFLPPPSQVPDAAGGSI